MLCKKCGSNISENSKFCGFCGESVSVDDNVLHQDAMYDNGNAHSEVDFGNTVRIEPVNSNVQYDQYLSVDTSGEQTNIESTMQTEIGQYGSFENKDELVMNVDDAQNDLTTDIYNTFDDGTVNETGQVHEENPISSEELNVPPMESIDTTKKEKKKTNRIIIIFLSLAIFLLALVGAAFVVTKTTNNSLEYLEKAFANFIQKGKDSATVDAKLSISTKTGESFSFSSKVKIQKTTKDLINMQITVNKSMMFDEFNLYAEITKDNAKLYTRSNVIDMIGMTSSTTPMWIYYVLNLDELILEDDVNSGLENVDLKEFADLEKIVFINKTDDISRYQLTLDKELIEQINKNTNTGLDTDSLEINNPIKIDFYINNSNELIKIQIDMSDSINELDDLSNCTMTIEFNDLGKTIVEIPSDAKNSIIDLETYMTNYSLNFGFEDENVDINLQ